MAGPNEVVDLTANMNDEIAHPFDPIDLTSDVDDGDDEDVSDTASEVSTLPDELEHLHLDVEFRNLPIEAPCVTHAEYLPGTCLDGPSFKIAEHQSVEIPGPDGAANDFFRVKYIIEDCRTGDFFLRGWRFRRANAFHGMLDPKLNEICRLMDVDEDDPRAYAIQAMETVPVRRAIKRRNLKLTNEQFPIHSFRDHTFLDSTTEGSEENRQAIFDSSELVCRWQYVTRFATAADRIARRKPSQMALCVLDEEGTDREYRVSDRSRTITWLGVTPKQKAPGHPHTFADVFCGAGGASAAAAAAGFQLRWACDYNEAAAETYGLNFRGSRVYRNSVDELIALIPFDDFHVDVLHFSPPCQPFARCNTRPNLEINARNHATFTAVGQVIALVKPRIVTLEETSGILSPSHLHWFHKLINMFTTNGYSVRWMVAHLNCWGHYQERKRLIIFTACPGGTLPEFPQPTFGPGTGRRFAWISDALAPIHAGLRVTHHNPTVTRTFEERPPHSPHQPMRNTITCDGGIDPHYSGTRKYTVRELACLQGLPHDFKFPAHQGVSALKRQIGNMWPAVSAAPFFIQAIQALESEDATRYSGVEDVEEDLKHIVIDD